MKRPTFFVQRLCWINLPAAFLVALLQRTPILRVAAHAETALAASPLGQVVRSALAGVASLGALHALAGATTFQAQQGSVTVIRVADSPPLIETPVQGTVGEPLTPVVFTYTGTPSEPQYFAVTGQLPPGLTFIPASINGVIPSRNPVISGIPAAAGSFSVRVQGFGISGNGTPQPIAFLIAGDTPPPPPPPPPPAPEPSTARLSNLSVRTAMAAGQTLIVGVVVNDGMRDILVRAAGPALANFGIPTAMTDPRLELYNGVSAMVFSNDDWPADLAATIASVGAFPFGAGSKDAAFVQGIHGAHSIQARGTGSGVVLVEAYDTDGAPAARLVNVSARNRVGAGEDILIAGVALAGTGDKQLLIRAVGPRLAEFGVTGVLADPKLEIYSAAGVMLTENDNWDAALASVFARVGAFELVPGSKDAALVASLSAGTTYTIHVKGADGGTGEALIEVYEVP